MFAFVEYPFVDLRPLRKRSSLLRPHPLERGEDAFLRNIGMISIRKRGGSEEWPGEESFCDATGLTKFDSARAPLTLRHRRIFTDGDLHSNCRFEMAFSFKSYYLRYDAARAAHALSEMRFSLSSDNDVSFGLLGKAIASKYHSATKLKDVETEDGFTVEPVSPMILLEVRDAYISEERLKELGGYASRWKSQDYEAVNFPKETQTLRYPAETLPGLKFFWVAVSNRKRVPCWVITRARMSSVTVVRKLRVHLVRLHMERECLAAALRLLSVNDNRADLHRKNVELYLWRAFKILSRQTYYGVKQRPIVNAVHDFFESISEGRTATLLATLDRINYRLANRLLSIRESPASCIVLPSGKVSIHMGDKISNRVGKIVGDAVVGSHVEKMQINKGALRETDLGPLAIEIAAVRKASRSKELSLEQEVDIGRLAEAEHFASQGKLENVVDALSRVGAWVLDFAKQTGASLLAQYLGGFLPS